MLTKTADSKGRVNLGERFANQTVIVEMIDETEARVTIAEVIPKRELWLQHNDEAKAAVTEGLRQARDGEVADAPPDLKADEDVARQLEGDA